MTNQNQIKCINKSDCYNPLERILSCILSIGGTDQEETRRKLSQHDAISRIESGKWQFYVNTGGKSVGFIVAKSAQGYKYMNTEADGKHPNNLPSLRNVHYNF